MSRLKEYMIDEALGSKSLKILKGIVEIIKKDCKPFLVEMRKNRVEDFIWRGYKNGVGSEGYKVIIPRKDRTPKDMSEELHDMFDNMFYKRFKWYPRSQGVFTTSNYREASNYGKSCIFFPCGKYEYIYSPIIGDLFTEVEDSEYSEYSEYEYEWNDDHPPYDENQYEIDFGEESGNGTWYYDDIDTGVNDIDAAIADISWTLGLDDKQLTYNDFKWVPKMSEDDWFAEKKEKWESEREDYFHGIIRSYTNIDLKKAIDKKVEIMFKCNRYLLINFEFYNHLKRLLTFTNYFTKNVDEGVDVLLRKC